jgi:uncharacterized damage-inducible protein DinB
MSEPKLPEPWLRGTLTDVATVPRAALHALELANADLIRWCGNLTDSELNMSFEGIASVAFHVRHIARSIDRLLTYAEGRGLDKKQIAVLEREDVGGATHAEVFAELNDSLQAAARRIRNLSAIPLDEPRSVGVKQLPTTVGGLLVHVADHTQRHVGQAVTTAKFMRARLRDERPQSCSLV